MGFAAQAWEASRQGGPTMGPVGIVTNTTAMKAGNW